MKWTKEQQQVIELRDRDILVSAAAGSGKTAVLVERIIKRITDEASPLDIDKLLVVTFTKAAAAQMRERIAGALELAIENDPGNFRLQRQATLLHHAMITTIDSFCLFVVRNHFDKIGLDPGFRIADEGEMRLLRLDTLDGVFERCYEEKNCSPLLWRYAGKRNDDSIRDMVLRIYQMSQSSPWPTQWIRRLPDAYRIETIEELKQSDWMKHLTGDVGRKVNDLKEVAQRSLRLCMEPDGPTAYGAVIQRDVDLFEQAASCEDYDALRDFLLNLSFDRLPALRNYTGDVCKKDAVSEARKEMKKELEEWKKNYFSIDLSSILEQMKRLLPVVEALTELTLSYEAAMAEAKQKKRILDFSDIEHFALKILVEEETGKRTKVAEEFSRHFEEIMIDEYQDSNQVQEEIMRAISKEWEGKFNLFMVGDVKQSIYRFRLARPELFLEKYKRFEPVDSSRQRIDLQRNFRSRGEVLDFCNDIFYKIMQEDFGGIAYDASCALNCGADYPKTPDSKTEVLLLDETEETLREQIEADEERYHDSIGKKELEAHLVAKKIRELMQTMQVTQDGQMRSLRYGDIVILFRSQKDWGPAFAKVLEGYGIPAHVESSTGYFSALEVQTVLNFLRILDNPYQDIPMAAVLRSPMVGLSEEKLAEIRCLNEGLSFGEAALVYMQEEEHERAHAFYEIYCTLRENKEDSVHTILQKVLLLTGYGNYVASMPAGERRSANLMMLLQKAIDFEKTSYHGVFDFIRYMEQMEKYEVDFGEADVTGEWEDVVRIMTIHKSKGLEFPVVFVSGMGKKFNRMELNDRMILHPDLGIGLLELREEQSEAGSFKVKQNSAYRMALIERLKEENLAEEMRVLYVALTRAKEKLLLTGVVSDFDRTIQKYQGNVFSGKPIAYRARASATTYLDWVIPALLSYPQKYLLSPVEMHTLVEESVRLAVESKLDEQTLRTKIENADEELVQSISQGFSFTYPYQSEVGKKSKYSVSELKHESMVRWFLTEESEAQKPEFLTEEKEPYVPCFMREEDEAKPSIHQGALRGTAVHRVMECMDFAGLLSLEENTREAKLAFVEQELTRLREEEKLAEDLYGLVVPKRILSFVESDVALRMAEAAKRGDLYREKPFVMQHEGVLVQGIIDAFWVEEDGIVLLDYKTDRVEEKKELVERYQTQMELYAKALAGAFSGETKTMSVKECLIYSFRLQEVIRL